ncbi:MAG: hypothetical protein HYX94_12810 [Chloroflexi bacterium]|nr:hypothetical protein [Chloroflexota bacterium]
MRRGLAGLAGGSSGLDRPAQLELNAALYLRVLAIGVLPWLSEKAARFDGRAMHSRLALALLTVSLLPLLVLLPVVPDLTASQLAAVDPALVAGFAQTRYIAFAVTIVVALVAAIAGWGLARLLAAPVSALMRWVDSIAAGRRDGALPRGGTTELVRLARAVQTMALALEARVVERERLIGQLQASQRELEAFTYSAVP